MSLHAWGMHAWGIMEYGSTPYVGMAWKKMAATCALYKIVRSELCF